MPRIAMDDIGYGAAHARLRKVVKGPCEECGRIRGRLEVALRHGDDQPGVRCSIRRSTYRLRYSTDPRAYMHLCHTCHVAHDGLKEWWVETPLSRARRFAR